MANFMRSALVRGMEVPRRQPHIAKVLEPHADRVLSPTIEKFSHGATERKDISVHVVGVYKEDAAPVAKTVGPDFKGEHGQQKEIYQNGRYTVYIGLGGKHKFDDENARKFGALAVRTAEKLRSVKVEIVVPDIPQEIIDNAEIKKLMATEAITLGAVLAAYRFDRRIGVPDSEKPTEVKEVHLVVKGKDVKRYIERGLIKAGGQNTARYLSDMPANELDTARYVQLLRLLAWKHGLHFGVLTPEQLVKMGREGIATVGAGAAKPGAMVLLGNFNGPTKPLHAYVGKGVVFDSGGISIKTPSEHMNEMHMDMAASASVAGAMGNHAQLSDVNNGLALLCIAQNAVGPNSEYPTSTIRIGDRTVQIMNTDAEGRIVMADGISLAAGLMPNSITSLATLTGAAMGACGVGMRAALMTDHDALKEMYLRYGDAVGERVQPFFMDNGFLLNVLTKTGPADLANLGPKEGGHMTAQAFLRAFSHYKGKDGKEVEVPYAGLDMAPVMTADGAMADDPRFRGAKFATGWGTQLLGNAMMRFGNIGSP